MSQDCSALLSASMLVYVVASADREATPYLGLTLAGRLLRRGAIGTSPRNDIIETMNQNT